MDEGVCYNGNSWALRRQIRFAPYDETLAERFNASVASTGLSQQPYNRHYRTATGSFNQRVFVLAAPLRGDGS
jgi:hypothetical protein